MILVICTDTRDPGNGRAAGVSANIECVEVGCVGFPQMPSGHYGIEQLVARPYERRNYLHSVVTGTSCPTSYVRYINVVRNNFSTHVIFEQLSRRGHGPLSLVSQKECAQDTSFAELVDLRLPLLTQREGGDGQGSGGKVDFSRQVTGLLNDAPSAHMSVKIIEGVEMINQAPKCAVVVKVLFPGLQ